MQRRHVASMRDKSYIFVTFIVTTEFVLVSHDAYLSMKKCFMIPNLSSDGTSGRWTGGRPLHLFRVRTVLEIPGRSLNLTISFSSTGISLNFVTSPGKPLILH